MRKLKRTSNLSFLTDEQMAAHERSAMLIVWCLCKRH